MEQAKPKSPRLFVCTAIENKDEIEEVLCTFLQFPTKNHLGSHVKFYFPYVDDGGATLLWREILIVLICETSF